MKTSLLFIPLYLLFSCDQTRVYEKNIDLDNKAWLIDYRIEFDFDIKDYTKEYTVYYLIRNTLEFPFSRLFVEYTLQNKSGNTLEKQLNSEYLFDPKTGESYGKNGLGSVFSHKFPLLKNYHFKKPGNYKIQLEQFNRRDTLQGILSVGVRVEYAE